MSRKAQASPLLPLLIRRMHLKQNFSELNAVGLLVNNGNYPTDQDAERDIEVSAVALPQLRNAGVEIKEQHWIAKLWLREDFTPPPVGDVLDLMGFTSPAVNELAAYILMNGKCENYYGHRTWSDSLVHTLLCGVDWAKSGGPENDSWDEFAGTFAEDCDHESVTAIKLECLCGYTKRYRNHCAVGISAFSIADLLSLVSGSFRDKM
jgi:hypothetical protein